MRRKKAEFIDHRQHKYLSENTPGDLIDSVLPKRVYCKLNHPFILHFESTKQSIHGICGDDPCSFLHNVPKPMTGCSIPFLKRIVGHDDNDDMFNFMNELLCLLPLLLLRRLDDVAVNRILLLLLLLNAETLNKEGDDRRRYEVVVVVRINVNMNLAIKLLSILNVATNTNT